MKFFDCVKIRIFLPNFDKVDVLKITNSDYYPFTQLVEVNFVRFRKIEHHS